MIAWNPEQYLKFQSERTQPAVDLAARLSLDAVRQAVDLGCGPGNSTAILAARFPAAKVLGIDNSPEMIEHARRDHPALEFRVADLAQWKASEPFDVIFSSAALQWVPHHEILLPALLEMLRPGGLLAIQMPRHYESPVHQALLTLARRAEWRDALAQVDYIGGGDSRFYYDLLAPLAARLDVWETIYYHVMPDVEAIIDWVRGTAVRPYLNKLDETRREVFLDQYRQLIAAAYPPQADGQVLFPFRRLFFVAQR